MKTKRKAENKTVRESNKFVLQKLKMIKRKGKEAGNESI